jgi:hypothetical protein
MCHEFDAHDWSRSEEETDDLEEEADPSFLNDEASEEVELLTDGGDE